MPSGATRRKRATPCAVTCTSCAAHLSMPATTIPSRRCTGWVTVCLRVRVVKLDLRLRIAAVLAIVCIAIVGALGYTLYRASEEMERALVEQLVSEEMDFLINRAQRSAA